MWRIWLRFDPRQGLVGVLAFAFVIVMTNHFVQLSTPRYGSWLDEAAPGAAVGMQSEAREERIAQAH